MSADETVEISKSLLRRVMAEVEEMRASVAKAQQDAEVHDQQRDAALRDLDAMRVLIEAATAEREAARKTAAEACKTISMATSATAERDRLQRDLDSLRLIYDDLRAEHAALLRTHPLPPTRRTASDNSPDRSDAETLARVFIAWCRRGSPLISRSYLFAAFLREAADQACEVRTVFRDRSRKTPTFTDRPASGIEYWLVTLGNLHALVPQPLTPRAFAETSGAFDGNVTPDRLDAVTLAVPDDLETPFGLAVRGTLA